MKVHPNVFDTVEDSLLFKLLSGPREVDLETRSFGEYDNNFTATLCEADGKATIISDRSLHKMLAL
jgi:hypothetical protein